MTAQQIEAFARADVATREKKRRTSSSFYRKFFPAAKVYEEEGLSVPEMVDRFIDAGLYSGSHQNFCKALWRAGFGSRE